MDTCFKCKFLESLGTFFICHTGSLQFEPQESPGFVCAAYEKARPKMEGRALELWKLMVAIDQPIAIRSLPKEYIGALGVLYQYDIVNKFEYASRSAFPKKSGPDMYFKDKYVELKL